VLASVSEDAELPVSEIGEVTSTESHSWTSISVVRPSTYSLREASGVIHSPFGSFDPIRDVIPLGPETLYDPSAMQRTGMLLVQSTSADMTPLQESLSAMGVSVIDVVPDDTVVIRVDSQRIDAIIGELGRLPSVRWAGQLPI